MTLAASWQRFVSVGAVTFARASAAFMFVVPKCVAAADADSDVHRLENSLERVARRRGRRLLRRARRRALRTNAFAGLYINPSLLVFVPGEVLTYLRNEHMATTTGRLNVRPLLLEAAEENTRVRGTHLFRFRFQERHQECRASEQNDPHRNQRRNGRMTFAVHESRRIVLEIRQRGSLMKKPSLLHARSSGRSFVMPDLIDSAWAASIRNYLPSPRLRRGKQGLTRFTGLSFLKSNLIL